MEIVERGIGASPSPKYSTMDQAAKPSVEPATKPNTPPSSVSEF